MPGRRLFFVLAAVALVYALLAGLRTVDSPDLGWQMATGHWIVQHHRVPSVDVLSYTAAGQPWIYPVGAEVLFYIAYLVGGFAPISWIGAAVCCGTVLWLLRRGTAATAVLAILAVFAIADRSSPRAEIFTLLLFAAFLSLLWENYQTGRAPLWLLPGLMFAWVNLHLGFVAGLVLVGAYVVVELSETLFGEARRTEALQRLRRAAEWLGYTVLATLFNPWGWNIYRALIRQERAMSQHQALIMEWAPLTTTWHSFMGAFSLRDTQGAIYLLLIIAMIAALLALLQKQLGAAILLLGAIYPELRHVRMGALFTCVVVVVGGTVLSAAWKRYSARITSPRLRLALVSLVATILVVTAALRSYDLVTNRYYYRSTEASTFGAGLGWVVPIAAADFIQHANLPRNIFNTYDEGGYLAWRLGPKYPDYLDGRAIPFGAGRIQHATALLRVSPDSDAWQQEAARYNINTIILPLSRSYALLFPKLREFCNSRAWRPVYLDETAMVLLRVRPETQDFIRRAEVDCALAPLPTTAEYSTSGGFNQWANVATLLSVLGRYPEALSASDNALAVFPESGYIHWLRGETLKNMGRSDEAEKEYLLAAALQPGEVTWSSLGDFYQHQGKISEALHARQEAVRVSGRSVALVKLANLYTDVAEPKQALKEFDHAMNNADSGALQTNGVSSLRFQLAQGRSAAWESLGDLKQATTFAEEAVEVAPDSADGWTHLANLYQKQGRFPDEYRAEARAAALNGPAK